MENSIRHRSAGTSKLTILGAECRTAPKCAIYSATPLLVHTRSCSEIRIDLSKSQYRILPLSPCRRPHRTMADQNQKPFATNPPAISDAASWCNGIEVGGARKAESAMWPDGRRADWWVGIISFQGAIMRRVGSRNGRADIRWDGKVGLLRQGVVY